MTKLRLALTVASAAAVLAISSALPAQAVGPVFQNGMAQIVPAFADSSQWIRQHLWVETDFDTDRDGRNDRVHVDVTRPAQTAAGLKVPVIYGSSPYYAGTSDFVGWDVRQELGQQPAPRGPVRAAMYQANRTRISNSLINAWVPRGFAVVHSEASGTGQSQGCPTVGDYPERAAPKFVVDWLNGRAKGYTTPTGNEEVRATAWSTGKVGMMGTSYEGTLPLAAATTGVQGLEVVIPIAPNTSYYHYYRSNGLVRSPGGYLGEDIDVLYDFVLSRDTTGGARLTCDRLWKNGVFAGPNGQDRATGDLNDFWAARDLLPYVKNIKAAVLLAHGLNDYNVMPSHSVRIYEDMRRLGLPVAIYLTQGGHGAPPPFDLVNRWFTHYLYGVDNGVPDATTAWIVPNGSVGSGASGGFRQSADAVAFPSFPVPDAVRVTLYPGAGGRSVGRLATSPPAPAIETLVDSAGVDGSANASLGTSQNRLIYATATLTDTVHLSGTARVTLRVAASKSAANLTVWLATLPFDSTRRGSQGRVGVLTRGWADIQNYKSLTTGGDYQSRTPGEPLTPGTYYDLTFDLEPNDQMIPAGKKLGVMIMSSDKEFTLAPRPGTQLSVDLARSSFAIPIVGGVAALNRANAFAFIP